MDPIWDYLIEGLLSNDPKEASKLRSRSARFTIHRGTLYKRGFFTPILKCIAKEDANYMLMEAHEGVCGNHIGARALAGKVLRQGYYWPTVLRDATELVRKCKVCQEHAKISHLPSEPLTSVTSPWPFEQWGLDILGPLPRAGNRAGQAGLSRANSGLGQNRAGPKLARIFPAKILVA